MSTSRNDANRTENLTENQVGGFTRREALTASLGTAVGTALPSPIGQGASSARAAQPATETDRQPRSYGEYSGEHLNRVAFPLGGMGAGMICLEGTGALSHFSLRNAPDVFNEPCTFAAISLKGPAPVARVLEGPVPGWKLFGQPGTGTGASGKSFGLPRFREARFRARFPFATVALIDPSVPLGVEICGWSPFEPGNADAASLPVAAIEYRFTNPSATEVQAVFSWNAANFLAVSGRQRTARPTSSDKLPAVRAIPGGFLLSSGSSPEAPQNDAAFAASVSDPAVKVNAAWFRGGWFDSLTMVWRDIAQGACYDRPPITEGKPSPGATLFMPLTIAAGATQTVRLRLSWYASQTSLRVGKDAVPNPVPGTYHPWYAGKFRDIEEVTTYWRDQYDDLRQRSKRFSDCFYDTTLAPEVIDAVAANLTILKSPTVLRQEDGRLWAWEGCDDNSGCCAGSCTHVWNYAQVLPHLFPALERTLRETEFGPSQDDRGHQTFRSALPIRPVAHDFHAAADGQLGGIIKAHREWRISGDTQWLRGLWPKVKASLDYCIQQWDPDRKGWVEEPHHNTYDIEFWGPDGMCTSFYLAALRAAERMGQALGEDVAWYTAILTQGLRRMDEELFNGEYYAQKIEWKNLRAKNPLEITSMVGEYSPEARALLEREGPKYQYGTGCLSDGVLGAWLARVSGVGPVLTPQKEASHVKAVHHYNLKRDLTAHANPQRPGYACGREGGLLLCTWPKGGEPSLPFVYSNEVWTGIEYQVASHLMLLGMVEEGLEVVRACRDRYDGRVRNPFNEYECGHWYARAMSSYALLQGLSGARYDAVDKVLYLGPSVRGDFRCFLSTAGGYGTVGVRNGQPFLEVKSGSIEVKSIKMTELLTRGDLE